MTLASELATRTGQNNRENVAWSVCRDVTKLSEEDLKNDMIFLQPNSEVSLPEEIKGELGIVPSGEHKYLITEDTPITAEMLTDKIVVQVIRSPWNFEKRIYVLTYDDDMSEELNLLLSDKTILEQLTGQIALVDVNGKVTNYDRTSEEEQEEKVPITWERIKYLIEKNTGLSIWLVIGAVVLVVIAIVIMFRVIGNRKRFKQAARNMERMNQKSETDSIQTEDFPMDEEEIAYKFQDYGDHYPEDEE